MVNYRCNAACRHCLYACSPSRRKGYVSAEKITEINKFLVKGRIGSVHIGGGEPFLDFDGLRAVIRGLADSGIRLDYIETNAFWARNPSCAGYLEALLGEGVSALCISIDPFHAEYVPWAYPIELAGACEKAGMGYFLWKQEFVKPLSRLDKNKRHSRAEIEAILSADYIGQTAAAYRIRPGGRAVNIEREFGRLLPAEKLLDNSPCENLLSTDHFHVDLDGFFIPPGCTGLRLPLGEILAGTEPGKYPVFEALYTGGLAALYRLAVEKGFVSDENGYPSKCGLCFFVRAFLASGGFAELDEDFYAESLKYY